MLRRSRLIPLLAILALATSSVATAQSRGRRQHDPSPPADSIVAASAWTGPPRLVPPLKPACDLDVRPPAPGERRVERRGAGFVVNACGQVARDSSWSALSPVPLPEEPDAGAEAAEGIATIDSMTTGTIYSSSYSPWGGIEVFGWAKRYYLSDGTSWSSGAGSATINSARFHHVETSGDTLRYFLIPPSDSVVWKQTDYNSGDHSAQGVLKSVTPLVLETRVGSNVATLSVGVLVASNEITWYGQPRFNFFSALPGAVVPGRVRYTLLSGTWTAQTFDQSFDYSSAGIVDFSRPLFSPGLVSLEIRGPVRIPDRSTTQYVAVATYEGGIQRDATESATWSVAPASLAAIHKGQLAVQALPAGPVTLALTADLAVGPNARSHTLSVECRSDLLLADTGAWSTYQANERHDGYVPIMLDPANFEFAWTRDLGPNTTPHAVAGADNRAFVSLRYGTKDGQSLFALDARDGHVMWTKALSGFSVNPTATAYGNVYMQTCNHGSDTWLHAFDGATGGSIFRAPHSAQWERYYAPTPFAGSVYVNGGYYGGAYAFDAFSGNSRWFQSLQQYDGWTPAVDSAYVYAYVGSYSPGLYVMRRSDGGQAFMIPDPAFEWNGWSMDLAPVLGPNHDVFAIHDGRLIRFDLESRTVAYQVDRGFVGQVSAADGQLFAPAQSGARLAVMDGSTANELWSWSSPRGSIAGPVIVTRSHVFVATADSVFAISRATHRRAWSRPGTGLLSLGNGQLYVAAPGGAISAIRLVPPGIQIAAAAGRDTTVECSPGDDGRTAIVLDGRGSTGAGLAFTWSGAQVVFDDPTSPTPTGRFLPGTSIVVLQVSAGGSSASDTVRVTVRDSAPPTITVSVDPAELWPPNGNLVAIHATVHASDGCDRAPAVRLKSIVSNEAASAPDGDVEAADLGTFDVDFLLRARREGSGDGRVYRICYEAEDASGQRAEAVAWVVVPHDQSGRARLARLATGWGLTVFGAATTVAGEADPASIRVRIGGDDVLHGAGEPPSLADADGDGIADATYRLTEVANPGVAASADNPAWARWVSRSSTYLAPLTVAEVAGVEDGARVTELGAEAAPNPAVGFATIRFAIPLEGPVTLRIFDLHGRLLETPVNARMPAGTHSAVVRLPAGRRSSVCFYELRWAGQQRTGRLTILR